VLLTRSRLCPRASPGSSLHLHVLSTPPAFVLSQDQTLREELLGESPKAHTRHKELSWTVCGASYTNAPRSMTGQSQVRRARLRDRRIEPGRTPGRGSTQVRMLLSFQRPPRPVGKGIPSQEARPGASSDRRGPPSIARASRGLQRGRRVVGHRVCGPRDCSASAGGAHGAAGRAERWGGGARRWAQHGEPGPRPTTAPAPTRSARAGGRRSPPGRSAATCRGPVRRRRSGSSRSARPAPRAGGYGRSCRG
jgi:hypothetical protein